MKIIILLILFCGCQKELYTPPQWHLADGGDLLVRDTIITDDSGNLIKPYFINHK